MLFQTRGILFHKTKYSESSIIAKIYTEKFGLKSYLIRGVRKSKAKFKANLFQSLSVLDLVVYNKEKSDIQYIKEVSQDKQYQNIPFEVIKSSIAIFINEILYKSIREEEANPELFAFIYNALIHLDKTEEPANFHIFFMLNLTKFLGFYPKNNYSESTKSFNLEEGEFQAVELHNDLLILSPLSGKFSRMIGLSVDKHGELKLTGPERKVLIGKLIRYYELHLPGFKNVRSHQILHEVLT